MHNLPSHVLPQTSALHHGSTDLCCFSMVVVLKIRAVYPQKAQSYCRIEINFCCSRV